VKGKSKRWMPSGVAAHDLLEPDRQVRPQLWNARSLS
jgi:hypothetical protein